MKLKIFGGGVRATLADGKLVAEGVTKKTCTESCISLYGQESTMITMIDGKDTYCVTGCGNAVGRNATINMGNNFGVVGNGTTVFSAPGGFAGHGHVKPRVFVNGATVGQGIGFMSGRTVFNNFGRNVGHGNINPQVFVNGVEISSGNATSVPSTPTSTEEIDIVTKIETISSRHSSIIIIKDSSCVHSHLSVDLKGSSDISISDATFDILYINISGAADLDLNKVKMDSLNVIIKGSGEIDGENTTAKNVGITISGSGSVKGIHVEEKGDLRIAGSGSIVLTRDKNADIDQMVSGSGKISVKKKIERD